MANNNKPQQQTMLGAAKIENFVGDKKGLLVKQTPRGWIWELLGCTARSEFKISGMEWSDLQDGYRVTDAGMKKPDVLYALEESNCLCRNLFPHVRPMQMDLTAGGEPGGAKVLSFNKPRGFPLFSCNCCPLLSVTLPSGMTAESQVYIDCPGCLVPHFKYSENDKRIYNVHPETCCGGCCIACTPCGKGMAYLPFYFHDPQTNAPVGGVYDGPTTPQIRKLWAGLAKECCTTADNFAVMFPEGISAERKAGILGLTFLLDFVVFERKPDED